jgi:HPt (histidine-containing phosphotransfer) domain-containing protein
MTDRSNSPFDVEKLLEQCMGNARIVALVLEKLEKQLTDDVKTIAASALAKDAATVARTAHALKGAAGAVAAASLHQAAAALEAVAKSGNLDNAEADLARLKEEVQRCAQYLPTLRQSFATPH